MAVSVAMAVMAAGAVVTGAPASAAVLNKPPVAVAAATPNPAGAGDTVTLHGTDSSDAETPTPELAFAWDFGDGSPATTVSSQNIAVDHVYVDAGVYTAVLTVTDPDGASDTDEVVVEVDDTAPVADATVTPSPAQVAEQVTFDATGTVDAESPHADLLFAWDFGDGSTGEGVTATHVYATAGTYSVGLTVTDPQGASDTLTLGLSVTNTAPVASNTITPASPTAGESVVFDGSSSTDAETPADLSYAWSFGDGTPVSTDATATHAYAAGGLYTVKLTVTDPQGLTHSKSTLLSVGANQKPTSALSASQTDANAGQVVMFDGSGSSDRETAAEDLTFVWDFGDGTDTSALTGPTAEHAFAADGSYLVKLTVTDQHANSSSASVTIAVGNQSPTASGAINPEPAYALQELSFDATSSSDAETPDTLSYSWTFGDGTAATPFGSDPVATHAYAAAGAYTVTLRVEDAQGARSTRTYTLEVLPNAAPVADPVATPSPARPDQVVSFDGSGSTDADGDQLTYLWELPDGSTSTEVVATQAFGAVGSYQATLTVTDPHGVSHTAQVTVEVVNAAPTAAALATPASAHVGAGVSFDGSGSTDPDDDQLTYLWEFPDGSTAEGASTIRSFDTVGTHEVRLTVTDPFGLSDTQAVAVDVANDAPVARFRRSGGFPLIRKNLGFDASPSSDTESTEALTYAWDLGDGTVSEESSFTHAFTRPGTYRVRLTVTDPHGASTSIVRSVYVARRVACQNRHVISSRQWTVESSSARGGSHCENTVRSRGYKMVYAEGDRFGLVFGKVKGGGKAAVYIDGSLAGYVWFGSTSDTMRFNRHRIFGGLGSGKHKIVVRMVRGTGYLDEFLVYGPLS